MLFLLASCGVDTGDGSDGACDDSTFTADRRTYNCESLTITGDLSSLYTGVGGEALIIRVRDDVTISGTLAADGTAPENSTGTATGANAVGASGGLGGAGGSSGGRCNAFTSCGDGITDNSGSGTGAGTGGRGADDATTFSAAGGGGGSGASFGTAGGNGSVGVGDGGTTPGSGGTAPATYGASSTWDISFVGGSGGGAGGFGEISGTPDTPGGAGGGGGGAIRIVAGGSVIISGTIRANGAGGSLGVNTGDNNDGGCGGGGSGGAIWIQTLGELSVSGTLRATGGPGGNCTESGGDGGAGGNGRIRLDDSNGSITITGSVSPTADVNTVGALSLPEKREYDGEISCNSLAFVDKGSGPDDHGDDDNSGGPTGHPLYAFFFGLLLAAGASTLMRKSL